ncbi:MAG: 3-deoxy-8-phosphooctulonate synthase [Oligoflexales bacterium]|nr:3-deoxy-8-phosphooctulonate synthase [Oligoflexales bacterium]
MKNYPIQNAKQVCVIAGPCVAESYELLDETADVLSSLSRELGFQLIFKASFDKANRSAFNSYRGPGLEQGLEWLQKIKKKFSCPILTDVHESSQVGAVAKVCDVIQIPAFLCRQTDLLIEALKTGCFVNIKKGQFMAPSAMRHIAKKAKTFCEEEGTSCKIALTERGFSFGYGDLVVDMRSFPTLAQEGVPVFFDITHSTQRPPANDAQTLSKADRRQAPILARSATATGYLDGYFMEVHPKPSAAKSDAEAQLDFHQAKALLSQLVPFWQEVKKMKDIDSSFV